MSHGVMSRSYLWCPFWYVLAVVSLLFIVQEQLWRIERSAEDGSWAFAGVLASEFPERECCDPVYPPPVPTAPSSSAATPTGRSGPNIKTAIAILNCLLARQLCFEDVSCSAILEIIPRVCGPELVACSTVTVTKCQAALRTLQAFPFFKPTCLCREPHVDPECNSFRDFLFDHPCVFVLKKEKDPYPVDALPTCNHALSVCQQEQKCIKLFEDFKTNCKVRDNKCRMDDRELCHESWTNLRLSPMFGCICPNNHMKRRCDRIFSIVNHNPCVDILPVSLDLSGTDSALYPYNPENGYFKNFWFPPTNHYPYFLYPPTSRPRSSYHPIAIATNNIISPSPSQSLSIHHYSQHQLPPAHGIYTYRTNKHLKHKQGLSSTGTFTATDVNDINRLTIEETLNTPLEYDEPPGDIVVTVTRLSGVHSTTDVKVISSSENASTTLDYGLDIELQLENPLVDSSGGEGHGHGHMHGHAHKGGFLDLDRGSNATAYNEEGLHHGHKKTHSSPSDTMRIDNELAKIAFQSTCHLALENCNKNTSCRNALEPVLNHCDMTRCDRNSCMDALQNLYRKPELSWSLEIAFCLCKKTDNKQDACLIAQEKLHPICAQRVEGLPLPTCHSLAEICRREKECRGRLEYYEQSCAVDSVTKKCAGPASECRTAMLGILGTELRTTCACKGTDFTQLYDCLGWQRLLWVNPCVVESQKDFHIKRAALQMTTTSTTLPTMKTTMQTPARKPRPDIRPDIPVPDPVTVMTITEPVTEVKLTTTTEFIPKPIPTTTTTTTTTQEPRFCVVQRPSQSDQKILEGSSKRLYHEDELECSELCQCGRGVSGVNLVCHTICVDQIPCKTDFAVYHHAAPAYQAYRGRCLCYSGQFICMRPTPGEYSLPQGVFLFLGYSERDEELLKPHSNMTVQDAVASLQEFMVHEVDNQTSCQLYLFNVTKSNVILVAKLADENNIDADEGTVLLKEQKECAVILETISEKINSQHPEFNSHLLLSIFKIAEVEIVKAELNSCPNLILTSSLFPILPISFLTWLIQKYHYSKIIVNL